MKKCYFHFLLFFSCTAVKLAVAENLVSAGVFLRDRVLNLQTDLTTYAHKMHVSQQQWDVSESHRQQEGQMWHDIPFVEQVSCQSLFALSLFLSSRAVITLQLWQHDGSQGICSTLSGRGSRSGNVNCINESLSTLRLSCVLQAFSISRQKKKCCHLCHVIIP